MNIRRGAMLLAMVLTLTCGQAKAQNNMIDTDNIYPILKVLEPADGTEEIKVSLPSKPIVGDLAVFFGIDNGAAYVFLDAVPEGMSLDSLYNIALTNHKKRLQGVQAGPTAFGGYFMQTAIIPSHVTSSATPLATARSACPTFLSRRQRNCHGIRRFSDRSTTAGDVRCP